MRTRTKLLIAAGAALSLSVAGTITFANAGFRGGWHGRDHGHAFYGRHHGGWGHHRFGRLMERYDANKDGKVTQEEIGTVRAGHLAKYDADKDNTLTLQEFQSLWLVLKRQRMVRRFQRFDRDGDGKITLGEYQRPLSRLVERMDRNEDGAISKEDRRRHWRRGRGKKGPREGRETERGN